MKKPRIAVVGSSNTDMVMHLTRIPLVGETMLGGRFQTAAGGKGANQAVAAARAGGEVAFIGRVGRDTFGDQAIAQLTRDGIDVGHLGRDNEAPSGVAMILVGSEGQNCIAVASGANAKLSPDDIEGAREVIKGADYVVVQLESPLETVERVAQLAESAGVPVILNPAPAMPLPCELLGRLAVLTPNEHEAEGLTGVAVTDVGSATGAADKLLGMGVKVVIITLGPRGAFVAVGQERTLVPAPRVTAIDTVAAGDVFNGVLAVGLGESMPLLEAVRFANAAAAISTTRPGAQPSAPSRREIQTMLMQTF